MKRSLWLISLAVLAQVSLASANPVTLYSTPLLDPTVASMALQNWFLDFSVTLADDFVLGASSLLENIHIFTYDTSDGSGGGFTQVQYAIYKGGPAPTGPPIASGQGLNLDTSFAGHR